jgi:hypothetical protein
MARVSVQMPESDVKLRSFSRGVWRDLVQSPFRSLIAHRVTRDRWTLRGNLQPQLEGKL